MSMFCYQCQEAAQNTGCTKAGICGKPADVANLQDLLIFVTKGVSLYSTALIESGYHDRTADHFMLNSLFATITNANFDRDLFVAKISEGLALRKMLKKKLADINPEAIVPGYDAVTWFADSIDAYEEKAISIGVLSTENEDIRSLREMITYGLKGIAAYVHHAGNLSYEDQSITAFMHEALAKLADDRLGADELTALTLETGKYGVAGMTLLDQANTSSYGNPEITKVNIGTGKNPGILISGHDLKDMEELLIQTKGTGVDVYTHSEMLPANYYPSFKKFKHFVGNYGGSWWMQDKEFDSFNGPILLTSNCIIPPRKSYIDRIYTTNTAGFPGLTHIPDRQENGMKDYSMLIAHAKKCQPPTEIETGEIVGGFAHHQVLALADKVVDAVKSGAIKRFFVMAGCDARMKSRSYYTDFAEALPQDTVILTAGCAKYRYNKLQLGDIGGIPRVLDAGQCNDSYSLVVIALKLKEVFELEDINDLPISYNIAWYEQKAVIVLLALLYLGVKNIHLGPTLPAFLSPNVANVLVEQFGIAGIQTVEEDMELFLA